MGSLNRWLAPQATHSKARSGPHRAVLIRTGLDCRLLTVLSRAMRIAALSALLLVLCAGCARSLPPAATPQRIAPDISVDEPVSEGRGRLVIDVVDGPAQIYHVHARAQQLQDETGERWSFSEVPEELCVSPCIVELPLGNAMLGFPIAGTDWIQHDLVHISSEPAVYRRALARRDGPSAGYELAILTTVLSSLALVTGVALLPIGLAKGEDGVAFAGAITLGAGALLLPVGIWGTNEAAPVYQPGSWNHYPLAGSPSGR